MTSKSDELKPALGEKITLRILEGNIRYYAVNNIRIVVITLACTIYLEIANIESNAYLPKNISFCYSYPLIGEEDTSYWTSIQQAKEQKQQRDANATDSNSNSNQRGQRYHNNNNNTYNKNDRNYRNDRNDRRSTSNYSKGKDFRKQKQQHKKMDNERINAAPQGRHIKFENKDEEGREKENNNNNINNNNNNNSNSTNTNSNSNSDQRVVEGSQSSSISDDSHKRKKEEKEGEDGNRLQEKKVKTE